MKIQNYAAEKRGNKGARRCAKDSYWTGTVGLFQRYRKNVIYAGQHQATEALSLFTCGKSPTGPNPGPRLEP